MEKIIFFGLVIPIIAYVLYLGGNAIMEGFKAKEANRAEKEELEQEVDLNLNLFLSSLTMSSQIAFCNSLNQLLVRSFLISMSI